MLAVYPLATTIEGPDQTPTIFRGDTPGLTICVAP